MLTTVYTCTCTLCALGFALQSLLCLSECLSFIYCKIPLMRPHLVIRPPLISANKWYDIWFMWNALRTSFLRITVTRELHSTTFEMNSSLHIRREERPTSPWAQRINLVFSQVSMWIYVYMYMYMCVYYHMYTCTLCVCTLCWDIVGSLQRKSHCIYMCIYNVLVCILCRYIVHCVFLHCARTLSSMGQLTMHEYTCIYRWIFPEDVYT